LAQLQTIRFLVSSGLLGIFYNHRRMIIDLWHAKIGNAGDKLEEMIQTLSMDQAGISTASLHEEYSVLLKLNLVLAPLAVFTQLSTHDVVDKLEQPKNVLEVITWFACKEDLHFFVAYLLLELQASLEENSDLSLRLKNLLVDFNHDLRVAPDAAGYFQGLFRLDELYVPRDTEQAGLPETEMKMRGIVHHSLK
jgi:hypothetical protein